DHVGWTREPLDEVEAARILQIHRGRAFVGIVLKEVERVLVGGGAADIAARIARAGIFDLDHVGAHPGERLAAGRTCFELGQVENLHSGTALLSAHGALAFLARAHYPRTGPRVEIVANARGATRGRAGRRAATSRRAPRPVFAANLRRG